MDSALIAYAAFAFLLGAILGSFYNVCIHRYLTEESILWPPSHCPLCRKRLTPWELIPIFSWLALRGRCAGCGVSISPHYPLVETASALWSMALALKFGLFSPAWLAHMTMGAVFIIASGIDLKAFILPDILTLPGAALAIILSIFVLGLPARDALIGAAVGSGVFWALQTGYRLLRGREGLGTGDIKLMALIGGLLGWRALPMVMLLGSLTALVPGVIATLKARRRVEADEEGEDEPPLIPFGPFLSLGAMLCVLLGADFLTR